MAVQPDDAGLAVLVGRLREAGCVFAQDEARLLCEAAADEAELNELTRRRAVGEPLELVVGWAEFRGLRIAVEPGVFVPRRRTEFLAEQAAGTARARRRSRGPVLRRGGGRRGAVRRDRRARVRSRRHRAARRRHRARRGPRRLPQPRRRIAQGMCCHEGDSTPSLPSRLAGASPCRPRTCPTCRAARSPSCRPRRASTSRSALDGGADGLDVLRRVSAVAAARWLRPGGSVLSEISERQCAAAEAAVRAAGLEPRILSSDDDDTTIVIGRAPA